tara:strand:- start:15417 stop:15794 length:378 start_codon:yes stop_codon:yes gene_type:complete
MKYARKPITGETVRVHKNLNTGKWSVSARIPKKGFQVIAHLDTVTIHNAIPKVSIKGVQRIREKQVRSVVARIEGTFIGTNIDTAASTAIYYNPYRNENFTYTDGTIYKGSSVGTFHSAASHFNI